LPLGQPEVDNAKISLRIQPLFGSWQVGTVQSVTVRSFIYTLITRNLDDVPSPENDSLDSVVL
jgi:hypothetical protein